MQELAWLIGHDVDLEKAKINQFFRIPFFEAAPMVFQETVEKVAPALIRSYQGAGIIKRFWAAVSYRQFLDCIF